MKYHSKIDFGLGSHYWWNFEKDEILSTLLLPFIAGQVILVKSKEKNQLLNLRAVSYLHIYRTEGEINRPAPEMIPVEFRNEKFLDSECTEELLAEVKVSRANVSALSIIQTSLAKPKPQVFVIMKFGEKELDSAYEGVIKPIITDRGLLPLRVDEIQDSGKITDQILEAIASSKFIIADLTAERPKS